jgi:CelD/BcsL family acetyltransferase involved in cellulose biosynthesis/RimJ/RimL family protein N-acetyltransferase
MTLRFAKTEEAHLLAQDDKFLALWDALYEKCGWATVFQSSKLVQIWARHYQVCHDFLLIYQQDEAGDLTGLLTLAVEKESGKLCAAGGGYAEYQTWLATPENANSFIQSALGLVAEEFPKQQLQFLFLAPGSPLGWLSESRWGEQSELRVQPRPLINVGDGDKFTESLNKRGNKTRLRQLRRAGEVKLDFLNSAGEFEAVFDEIENYAKLRMSALHNVAPRYDECKKPFYTALFQEAEIIEPSVLRVGDRIASAQICLKNNDEACLGMTAMSPFFAGQSPSKIHILMLGQEFAKQKIATFDLTPGMGYKERFATHYDNAYTLTIFFDKDAFIKHRAKRRAIDFAKNNLEKLNIRKTKAFAMADKLRHKIQQAKAHTIPRTLWKNVRKKIHQKLETRMYLYDVEKIAALSDPQIMRRNNLSDVLKYEAAESWQFTRSEFHQVAQERFADGCSIYTYVEEGVLLHFGWLLPRQEVSFLFEVGQHYEMPPDTAVLFDFYTHPKARGKGLYRKSLSQMLHAAAQIPGTKNVSIAVLADNGPSRHVIEKVGFKYVTSLHQEIRLGRVKRWRTDAEPPAVAQRAQSSFEEAAALR